MALVVEEWPIGRLVDYEKNPRKNDHAIPAMVQNLTEFGFRIPVLARSDGAVIDGHLRLKAARTMGMQSVPVTLADDMTPMQVKAFRLAVNRSATWADWDDDLLAGEILDLKEAGFDLTLTGFSLPETDAMFENSEGPEAPITNETAVPGALLERVNITIAEPTHTVARGDHYLLAKRHHLLCVSVIREWTRYVPLLKADCIFCPYPGPFVPYGETAEKFTLVMVQPDQYVTGHLLDRYVDCFGEDAIQKVPLPEHMKAAA